MPDCFKCGYPFITTDTGITHHVGLNGENYYEQDLDHVAYGEVNVP